MAKSLPELQGGGTFATCVIDRLDSYYVPPPHEHTGLTPSCIRNSRCANQIVSQRDTAENSSTVGSDLRLQHDYKLVLHKPDGQTKEWMEQMTAVGRGLIQHHNIMNAECKKKNTFCCRASSSARSFSAFFRSFARRFFSFSFSFCFSFCRCSSSCTETTSTGAGESKRLTTPGCGRVQFGHPLRNGGA